MDYDILFHVALRRTLSVTFKTLKKVFDIEISK
jgi:hypothetical protein